MDFYKWHFLFLSFLQGNKNKIHDLWFCALLSEEPQRDNLSFLVLWLGWHLILMIFLSYCCCFSEHFVMRWIRTFLLLILYSHSSLKRIVAYFAWAGSISPFFYTEVFFSWWLNVNLNSRYLQAFTIVVLLLLEFKTHILNFS